MLYDLCRFLILYDDIHNFEWGYSLVKIEHHHKAKLYIDECET